MSYVCERMLQIVPTVRKRELITLRGRRGHGTEEEKGQRRNRKTKKKKKLSSRTLFLSLFVSLFFSTVGHGCSPPRFPLHTRRALDCPSI